MTLSSKLNAFTVNRLANRTANRVGYRAGYLTGYRAGNRVGYLLGYKTETDSGTGSLTESPHVRAIASRPDPSRPVQTEPARTRPTIPTREVRPDYPNFTFCRKSRRRARASARGAESAEAPA